MASLASTSEPSSIPHIPQTATAMAMPQSYKAAHAVLNTNELLCDIIGYLPLKDIVISTGVCHTWRKALKSITAIQQALYLTPADVREVLVPDDLIRDIKMPITLDKCLLIGEMHPFLHKICGCIWPDGDYIGCADQILHALSLAQTFAHPDGIWRDMFVTQPPCKVVHIRVNDASPSSPGKYIPTRVVRHFKRESGIEMGELYDIIHSIELRDEIVFGSWARIGNYAIGKNSYYESCYTTRCKVSNGMVCRPAQVDASKCESSDDSSDFDHLGDSDFEHGEEDDNGHGVKDEDGSVW